MILTKTNLVSSLVILAAIFNAAASEASDLRIHRTGSVIGTMISDSAGGGAMYTWAASLGQVLNSETTTNYAPHRCNTSDLGFDVRFTNVASTPFAPSLFGSGRQCCPLSGMSN